MAPRAATVRLFAPELWGQVETFSRLCSGTYAFNKRAQRALAGITQHFEKAVIFQTLASKLRPNLEIDRKELDDQGFTPAANSRELAAVIEAAVVELYSSVDCTAKVLHAIYGGTSRRFKESTRSFFQNFEAIEGTFPDALKTVLRDVDWYQDLCFLRDELTHLGTGTCHLGKTGASVTYMHGGIRVDDKPFIVDDVFAWLSRLVDTVNAFLGRVFYLLRQTLTSNRVYQLCGMVEGRMLMRYVNPTEQLTFDSGECGSYHWFEQPDAPACPFMSQCGAYARTRPTMVRAVEAGTEKVPNQKLDGEGSTSR